MRVSVVLPVYQAAHCLPACLHGLLAQTLTDLEVLCVDDGSTDGGGALLDEAAARDARVRVLHQPNAGVSAARNAGIAAARGDYIAFVDADDALPPDALEKLAWAADGADIVTADHLILDEQGRATPLCCAPDARREDILASLTRCDGRYNAVWGKLYRRAFLHAHALCLPQGMKIGEDVVFNLQAFAAAARWVHVPEPLYRYQLSPASAMGRAQADVLRAHEPMLDAIDAFLRARGKARFYRDFLEAHAGLLARSRAAGHPATLDRRARARINGGVSPRQLPGKQRALWLALACGCGALACRWVSRGMHAPPPA